MPFNILPVVIILVCLVLIVITIVRKFPTLAMIDVSTIRKERDIKTKEKIIQERLERQLKFLFTKISPSMKKTVGVLRDAFRSLYKKIQKLEATLEEKAKPKSKQESLHFKSKLEGSIAEAEELFFEKKIKEAEEKYIEVIRKDPKNKDAYKGLIRIYSTQDEEQQVKETSNYLLRILKDEKEKADTYCMLGEYYRNRKNFDSAVKYFRKALALQENNPKFLDFLLDVSIMVENKELALEIFEKLHVVNPDNQKLPEYKEKIEKLIVKQG
ncbi:MAG TPA: tetratricopeptide repeat protein [Patescibacteria group bacterium]|nr:tetratricopeptide repeat protein [Patescibacteria group bacterium]